MYCNTKRRLHCIRQRRGIVELGLDTGRAFSALALARELAMTTYRSAREFGERFDACAGANAEFPVERYLQHCGQQFAVAWRPERFLALSLSADLHRVNPRDIRVPTVFVAAEGDQVVPRSQTDALASQLGARDPDGRATGVPRPHEGPGCRVSVEGQLPRALPRQSVDTRLHDRSAAARNRESSHRDREQRYAFARDPAAGPDDEQRGRGSPDERAAEPGEQPGGVGEDGCGDEGHARKGCATSHESCITAHARRGAVCR